MKFHLLTIKLRSGELEFKTHKVLEVENETPYATAMNYLRDFWGPSVAEGEEGFLYTAVDVIGEIQDLREITEEEAKVLEKFI